VRAIEGQELALIAVVGLLWVVLSLATDTFLTTGNLQNILFTVAPIALVGIGMTAVIVTAGIDVSVGSGLVLRAVNGLLVAYGGIHPIIVTFGTLNIYRFVALQIFGTEQVAGVPATLAPIGGGLEGRILGVPTAWWLALLLAAGMWCYMRFWATGRHLYAVGGDPFAARLAGVRVRRRQISAYVLTGACVGLAACVLIGSGGLVQQNVGTGLELRVIAAVVIGGTSIIGGRGTVLGTLLGALLVGTVSSAVTLLSWPSELTQLFIGLFILVAVGVDLLRERRRSAR
jgi:ribose transport system permease protein